MKTTSHRLAIVLAFGTLGAPAFADDCTTAMLTTAAKPASTVLTRTDGRGKQIQAGTVQLPTIQYIQSSDGQWHSVDISVQDKIDATKEQLTTAKHTCARLGSDTVNGVATTIYALHLDLEGATDTKIWVASNHLIVRVDGTLDGTHYTSTYDYSHVTAPANAKPMGSR